MAKLNPFAGSYQGLLDQFSATRRNGESLAADVFEEEGNILVEMDLAGVDPDNVDIWVEGNQLYISGYREEIDEEEDRNYYMKEIRYGSFERVIPIPSEVDAEQADASFEDGVLNITLPKIEESKKKIASKAKKKAGEKKTDKAKKTTAKKDTAKKSSVKANGKDAKKTSKKANAKSDKNNAKSASKTSAKKTGTKSAKANNNKNSKTATKKTSTAKKAGSRSKSASNKK